MGCELRVTGCVVKIRPSEIRLLKLYFGVRCQCCAEGGPAAISDLSILTPDTRKCPILFIQMKALAGLDIPFKIVLP